MRTFRYRRSGAVSNPETYSQLYAQPATLGPRPPAVPKPKQREAERRRDAPGYPGHATPQEDDMQQSAADYTQLDDPALFAERRRLREKLESLPERHADRTRLAATLNALTGEADRRARAAWQQPQNPRNT